MLFLIAMFMMHAYVSTAVLEPVDGCLFLSLLLLSLLLLPLLLLPLLLFIWIFDVTPTVLRVSSLV
jgi:hypothetical protein